MMQNEPVALAKCLFGLTIRVKRLFLVRKWLRKSLRRLAAGSADASIMCPLHAVGK